jgi:hypothetical protein
VILWHAAALLSIAICTTDGIAASELSAACLIGVVSTYLSPLPTFPCSLEFNVGQERLLENEANLQDDAVVAAKRSLDLSTIPFKGRVTSYLEVTTAQTPLSRMQ